jgi:hypothetical protein
MKVRFTKNEKVINGAEISDKSLLNIYMNGDLKILRLIGMVKITSFFYELIWR